jgi:hypothetical protein
MANRAHAIAISISGGVSLGLSALLAWDAFRSATTSAAELQSQFAGAAYADAFGLGFWPFWGIAAVIQAIALTIGWRATRVSKLRFVFPAFLVLFAIASFTEQQSWQRAELLFWNQGR